MASLPYAYGIMRFTDATSDGLSSTGPRRCRFALVDFLVRMWRLKAWPRLIDPLLRTTKRLAALFFVFILGMVPSFRYADRRPLPGLRSLSSLVLRIACGARVE